MSQRHRAEAAELPPTEELRAHARGERHRIKAAKSKRPRHWKLKSWKRRSTLRRQKAVRLRVVADEP